MNYRWRGAALDFFAWDKTTPGKFDAALTRVRNDYPASATAVMLNMLGSHDVERLLTLCKGDRDRERMAVAFQMTYPGAPCVYYGDEVGLEGGKDPDDRRGMPWDEKRWDRSLYSFYRAVISMRNRHAALRRGDYKTIITDDSTGIYGFVRSYRGERAAVVFNRSDEQRSVKLPLRAPGRIQSWIESGAKIERQGDQVKIVLPKRGFAVIGID